LISYGFLAPPAVFILLTLAGALVALRWRRLGIAVVILSSVALYVFAMPLVASWLLSEVESGISDTTNFDAAQAIVVLGGGVRVGDDAGRPDTLKPISLERLFYAADAYRRLRLPVAVSGGRSYPAKTAEALLMRDVLERDFGVPVMWSDDQSRNTNENALYTARLLLPAGIRTVVLVTHAWHMPRALWAFERAGLKPVPWPAPRDYRGLRRIDDVLPSITALHDSFYALHELIGGAYYRLRY